MRLDFYWHAYKYMPYERTLARRELIALIGRQPVLRSDRLSVEGSNKWEAAAYRTTYFREVVSQDGSRIIPLQAKLEASSNNVLTSSVSDSEVSPSLHRQSTRYSAHGLHEYRGKFNPQIVRAIGNILGLQAGQCVLDPFCGSGTTLLEAVHVGWNAIGLDLNPLGIFIARAKIAVQRIPLDELHSQTEIVKQRLSERFEHVSFNRAFSRYQMHRIGDETWRTRIPNYDYLRAWFTDSVLLQLSMILREIEKLPSCEVQLILRVILSDILREVSLQDPADLRVRRRKSPPQNAPAIPLYLDAVTKKIATVTKARQYLAHTTAMQDTLLGDARCSARFLGAHPILKRKRQFDAAITSPPYVTALPYIDTQRLSLVLLGLIGADEIRATEKRLVGNREITTGERDRIEQAMNINADHLPCECLSLCRKLSKSVDIKKDGFRRRNVPALTYRYLVDMMLMFGDVRRLLRPKAPFALLVGRNRTRLGGHTWVIDTPRLLALLAENSGFSVHDTLELDTYQRFDVHQANSIRSETLLILKAK